MGEGSECPGHCAKLGAAEARRSSLAEEETREFHMSSTSTIVANAHKEIEDWDKTHAHTAFIGILDFQLMAIDLDFSANKMGPQQFLQHIAKAIAAGRDVKGLLLVAKIGRKPGINSFRSQALVRFPHLGF